MKRKKLESSAHEKQIRTNVKYTYIADKDIDYSDIPELTNEQLKEFRKGDGLTTIRIDPNILKKIKKLASKKNQEYEIFIHEILKKFINKRTAKKTA